MSVYHLTFTYMDSNRSTKWGDPKAPVINNYQCLRDALEKTNHTFIFIITKTLLERWESVCNEYGYREFILYEMPYMIHNYRYVQYEDDPMLGGRKLKLIILRGKGTNED